MPKRKRDEVSGPNDSKQDRGLSGRRLRAEQSVQRGQTLLFRAFKAAKGFERQKLSRRSKTAASKKDASLTERVDAEIAAIKHLDLHKAAASYLHKSLLKIKAVSESKELPPSLTIPPIQPSDAATLNVIARLCNSNPVREALPAILKDVEEALGIASRAPQSKAIKSARPEVLREASADSIASEDDEVDDDNFGSDVLQEARVKQQDASDDEDSFAAFDSRLASSDDESDGPAQPPAFDPRSLLTARGASSEEDADSDSNADLDLSASDSSHEPRKASRPRTLATATSPSPSPSPSRSPSPKRKATTSAFLPSLTSGYISGSESDPDLDDEALTGAKKNRRGQRARRAIWEKKFGKEAKHVKEGGEGRDAGWDAKRGATEGGGRGGRGGRGGARGGGRGGRGGAGSRGGRGPMSSGANDIKVGERAKVKHKDDEGKLHPSWEAAKKRKEGGAPAQVAFAGKKISFD